MSFCLRRSSSSSSTQSTRPHPVSVCVCWKCVSQACRKLASGSGNFYVCVCVCVSWLSAWFTQYRQAPVGHAFVCLSLHTHSHRRYAYPQTICMRVPGCVRVRVHVWAYVHVFAFICNSVRDNGSFSHSANSYKTRQFKAFAISSTR